MVAGQNICSAAAREWGRGLTSRRTSLCVYLGNNYVNGFSSLPVAACLSACSAHPPSGQSCSLSLFLFYHSFVAQFAGKHDVLFWNLSVWETWRRSGRPTNKCRPPWDGCLWRAKDARAANGCCQHVTRTDGGRDAPALSPLTRLLVLHSIISPITTITIAAAAASVVRESSQRPGAVSEGRTRFGSTVHDI